METNEGLPLKGVSVSIVKDFHHGQSGGGGGGRATFVTKTGRLRDLPSRHSKYAPQYGEKRRGWDRWETPKSWKGVAGGFGINAVSLSQEDAWEGNNGSHAGNCSQSLGWRVTELPWGCCQRSANVLK